MSEPLWFQNLDDGRFNRLQRKSKAPQTGGMFDSTLHSKTIAKQIRSSDFHSHLWSFTNADRDQVIASALERATEGFVQVALRQQILGGKPVYQQSSLAEVLITRHIADGIRRITSVRQADRQSIVKSLIALAKEGTPFHIMKFDVKSFYETIDVNDIIALMREDAAFSRQSVRLLTTFFDALQNQGISGLPRGLGLSATLSELAMREYDRGMSATMGVRFYSRFVDDAIIVAVDTADLSKIRNTASSQLPNGLALNRTKTKEYSFRPAAHGASHATEHVISFLGYKLNIGTAVRLGGKTSRRVVVDIADKKVARLKKRIAKALLQYQSDNNFVDLHARIKLLTSNYGFIDPHSGQQRFSGLRYNYSLIDTVSADSLDRLDRFLVNALTANHPNNRLLPNLSSSERRSLLGFGFRSGFISNRFFSFTPTELKHLNRCWYHA